ncbi:MAG: flagellar assembly protein FliW [Lachnospiraceae bacterium]|nr:flagellar assembly protein FliW [Lachnospiraceae bacterium]MBR5368953.1 flagellar assembly protein FliW [Lachnospiraceae bacterium]
MRINTRYFGTVDLDDDKVIVFDDGLFGFEEYKKFALIFNNEAKERPAISWLQSVDEQALALPVMIPTIVKPDYNPVVEDDALETLGDWNEENISVLVTVTVPEDLKNMTTNLKAPIIINTDTMKGVQTVVENQDYEIRFKIYDLLKAAGKEEA